MYRFTIGSKQIECDTAAELLAVVESCGGTPATKTPTTKKRRAKKTRASATTDETGEVNVHSAAHSWNLAKFYVAKPRIKLGVIEARAKLAADPALKKKVEKEYLEAQGVG